MLRPIPSSSSGSKVALRDDREKFSMSQLLTAASVSSVVSVLILSLSKFVPILLKCPHNAHCYEADVEAGDLARICVAIFIGIATAVAATA